MHRTQVGARSDQQVRQAECGTQRMVFVSRSRRGDPREIYNVTISKIPPLACRLSWRLPRDLARP
jgi:hypothetical protein